MRIIFLIFFIFFSNSIFANQEDSGEVEVINLYESKSLDQMVLDNLNEENRVKERIKLYEDELVLFNENTRLQRCSL